MCLIVFAWQAHPRYHLILAANRDELHNRPAEAAGWWQDHPEMLAGRDLAAGGTWLAVGKSGRFATVTNYREDRQAAAGLLSRGDLVTGFLAASSSPLGFAGSLQDSRYAGFSLLLAAGDELAYVSNRGEAPRLLPPGVYGLSNCALDTPWPKLVRSRDRLRRLLRDDFVGEDSLLHLLGDTNEATKEEAENGALPYPLPQFQSSPFIVSQEYGTRCSTALLHGCDGTVTFSERRFDCDGDLSGQSRFEFAATPALH